MNTSLALILVFWFVAALFVPIFSILELEAGFRLYYSNILQIFSALISAALCYYVAMSYEKENPSRRVWSFLGIAMTCWLIGNLIYTSYPLLHQGEETPFPYYSDIGYIGFYFFVVIALFTFKNALDIVAPTWGKLLGLMVFLMTMAITFYNDREMLYQGGVNSIVALFYIISVPTFIGTAVLVASGLIGGLAVGPWWFIVAGAFAYYVGDQLYAYLLAKEQYTGGSAIDFFWILGFYMFALAAIKTRLLFARSR